MNAPPDAVEKYHAEYPEDFVDLWDRLVGWDARAKSEGTFFIDLLREHGARRVLDAATGNRVPPPSPWPRRGVDVVAVDGAADHDRQGASEPRRPWPGRAVRDGGLAPARRGRVGAVRRDRLPRQFVRPPVSTRPTSPPAWPQFHAALAPGGGLMVIDQRNYDAVLDGTLKNHRSSYCCCGGGASVDLQLAGPDLVRITYTVGGRSIEYHRDPSLARPDHGRGDRRPPGSSTW